jgi:hypothetical protein
MPRHQGQRSGAAEHVVIGMRAEQQNGLLLDLVELNSLSVSQHGQGRKKQKSLRHWLLN